MVSLVGVDNTDVAEQEDMVGTAVLAEKVNEYNWLRCERKWNYEQ